jgi:hypothetical protein
MDRGHGQQHGLQLWELTAEGAPHHCAPAVARAGRRWRTTSGAENTNCTTGTRAIKRKAMEDMLVQALLTVRKGKAQYSQQHGRLEHDGAKADPTSMGCFLMHNNGTLRLMERSRTDCWW